MTSKQFYILLALFVISLKVQKLPCFMFDAVGKDSYLLFLMFIAVNLVGILMAVFVLKINKQLKVQNKKVGKFVLVFQKMLYALSVFYFIVQALLLYEHIQDLFSNTLFDNMPWWIFSLLLLFAVFYLAHSGIKNIALGGELYIVLIVFSYIVIGILSGIHTDFSNVLPFETIKMSSLADNFVKFNTWFGDFFVILFLGNKAKDFKLGKTLLTYILSTMFVVFLVVCFNGIYLENTALQAGMISEITERSMIGMNIGRIDWFLILITEIGAIISCGLMLFFAQDSARKVFCKTKSIFIEIALAFVIYYFDIFYLVDMHAKRNFFYGFVSYYAISLKVSATVLLFLMAVIYFFKDRKTEIKKFEKKG